MATSDENEPKGNFLNKERLELLISRYVQLQIEHDNGTGGLDEDLDEDDLDERSSLMKRIMLKLGPSSLERQQSFIDFYFEHAYRYLKNMNYPLGGLFEHFDEYLDPFLALEEKKNADREDFVKVILTPKERESLDCLIKLTAIATGTDPDWNQTKKRGYLGVLRSVIESDDLEVKYYFRAIVGIMRRAKKIPHIDWIRQDALLIKSVESGKSKSRYRSFSEVSVQDHPACKITDEHVSYFLERY